MPAHKPEDLPELYVQALNSGDLDGLVALFEPEACMSPEPRQVVAGAQAIREALSAFLAMKPKLTQEVKTLGQTSDIALSTANWHLTGTGPDGNTVDMRGQSLAVLRQRPAYLRNWLALLIEITGNPYLFDTEYFGSATSAPSGSCCNKPCLCPFPNEVSLKFRKRTKDMKD
jgi:uncharacterized protein (TIGR02246 family)